MNIKETNSAIHLTAQSDWIFFRITKGYERSKLSEEGDDLESRDIHQAFVGDLELRDHGEG